MYAIRSYYVLKERNEETLLAWMAGLTGHHWVTHGLLDLLLVITSYSIHYTKLYELLFIGMIGFVWLARPPFQVGGGGGGEH